MKTIEIEKALNLKDAIDLLPVSVQEQFTYKEEEDGIRCVGPFYLHGRYTTLNEVKDFQDAFEFDVFAAHEKLDGEPFSIAYQGYDYSLDNGVTIIMHFNVFGIKADEEQEYFEVNVPTQMVEEALPVEQESMLTPPLCAQMPLPEVALSDEQKAVLKDALEEEAEDPIALTDQVDVSMIEELFEQKDNVITSYSFVVVKKDDSYESIAHRYDVDVEQLRQVNENKELQAKNLVVLPYGK